MSSNQPERKTDMSELDEVVGLLKHLLIPFQVLHTHFTRGCFNSSPQLFYVKVSIL